MDAGVPIHKHVAGIAMGLIFENDEFVVLTDILGMEDHLGDMDFKVAGTRDGITAFQMDVKTSQVNKEVLQKALEKAKIARLKILDKMYETIPQPRKELSPYVPIMKVFKIPVSKIGEVIGPGGKNIKEISELYNVEVYIEDDGKVKITGHDPSKVDEAIKHIQNSIAEVEKGGIFEGTVKRIEKYGIFVEVLPGKVGMLHVSNLKDKLETFKIGDKVKVEVMKVEDQGKFQLKQLKEGN
jgi:polyribonucleotide nucleotidyltransferase